MEKNEKITFVNSAEKYIEDHKIYDLFEHLTKQLLIKRPDSPLNFLIEQLSNPKFLRIIFINGASESHNNEISNSLGYEFNLKCISINTLILAEAQKKGERSGKIQELLNECLPVDDDFINDLVIKQLNSLENNFKGAIIIGYPKTLQQALFIQEKGIIPEKFFILEFSESKVLKEFENKVAEKKKNETPEKILERAQLLTKTFLSSIRDVKQAYENLYTSIDCSDKTKETIISLLKGIIYPRYKKIYPLRPPRVLIIRPPGIKTLGTKIMNSISENFDVVKVSVGDLIQNEIDKKTEIGKFSFEALSKNETIPDDILGCLMKTAITKTSSKFKGWVLEGFPKNLIQFNKFVGINITPHIVIILDENEENLKSKFGKIVRDPQTFRSYESYELGKDFNEEIRDRLLIDQKYSGKNMFKIIEDYKDMVKKIYNYYTGKCFVHKIDNFKMSDFLEETKKHLNDPKIYN